MKFIVDKSEKVRYTKRVRCERYKNKTHRCVAQLGRALRSGRRGRRFRVPVFFLLSERLCCGDSASVA